MFRVTDTKSAEPLLSDWSDTFVKTCLDGRIGAIYSTKKTKHETLLLTVGEFILFAGLPDPAAVRFIPDGYCSDFAIMIAKGDDDRWHRLIEEYYGDRAKKETRYAIKKEGVSSFVRAKLEAIAADVADGYRIVPIDRALYGACRTSDQFYDLVSQYPTYEDYETHGLGFMALCGDETAAGCSSFSDYPGGVEIEISTRPEHRRRHLASAVAARFILECIDRGLYPSWDAANLSSLALAEKLGYRLDHTYTAYEISGYKSGNGQ